jgi:hypothetical protein
MEQTIEFLNKMNWFLKPFANLILFFFTTKIGIISLLILFLIYVLFVLNFEIKTRSLAYRAVGSIGGRGRVPFFEKLFIAGRVLTNMFLKIISNVPVVLSVVIFLIFVVGMSKGIETMDTFVKNQQKIKELKSILKQLNKRYKVAEIDIVDYDRLSDKTKMDIRFYDYALQGFSQDIQHVEIQGNDIYFDAVVLNFEYSEISSGNATNIVLPYRIFSNKVPQGKGIPLNLQDKNGIPLIFKRNENDIYAVDADKYTKRVKEIMSYITDKKKARAAGIRSVYGNAVHKTVRKGDKLIIWVEQTGGLVIKNAVIF